MHDVKIVRRHSNNDDTKTLHDDDTKRLQDGDVTLHEIMKLCQRYYIKHTTSS